MTASAVDPDHAIATARAGKAAQDDEPVEAPGPSPRLTLDGFTGPLERLLILARARQIDLGRLSLADLMDQLAAALRHAPAATPLGQKGDWVVTTAWLLQLRSLLLLPVETPARQAAEAAADQLRERLVSLQAMRALVAWLAQRPQLGREVFARGQPEAFGIAIESPPPLDVIEFLWSSMALFDDAPVPDMTGLYRPRLLALYAVPEARVRILQRLAEAPDGRLLETLLPETTETTDAETPSGLRRRSAWASTFLASLELARQGDVALTQAEFLSPIHVRLATDEVG
jgi:segregation and condensation protein A